MRLGDLDALKEALKSGCKPELCHDYNTAWCESCSRVTDFEDLIDNAPTIGAYPFEQVQELVKLNQQFAQEIENLKRTQGEWLYPYANVKIGGRRVGKSDKECSVCHTGFSNNLPWNAKFCPNCGADMRGAK